MLNQYVRKIGITNNSDFKDYAKIGEDYLFQRWESVCTIINQYIKEEYRFFLARPDFESDSDTIVWYTKDWSDKLAPIQIGKLESEQATTYKNIFNETLNYYRTVVSKLPHDSDGYKILNRAIRNLESESYTDNFVFAVDNYVVCVAWGMSLLEKSKTRIDSIIMDVPKLPTKKYSIKFQTEEHGSLQGTTTLRKPKGYIIQPDDIPNIQVESGYEFIGWNDATENHIVQGNKTFVAQIRKVEDTPDTPPIIVPEKNITIHFLSGTNGTLNGQTSFVKSAPYKISTADIPKVSPENGYEFVGWDKNPADYEAITDISFTAQYKKVQAIPIPWYKRLWLGLLGLLTSFWLWFKRKGWKWLLLILFLILLCCLLRRCINGSHPTVIDADDQGWIAGDENVRQGGGGIYDPGNPYRDIPSPTDPGSGYEDLQPILPDQPNELLPIDGEPEIIPGNPTIIGNRLNVLMENEEKSVLDFIRAFKTEYPTDQYQVVYYDDIIKRVQIEIPSEEREQLKRTLPSQFSEYQIFVFDEALFEGAYIPNDPAAVAEQKWYLTAIEAFDAWDITKGSENIVVAVVDNGFNLNHPEFKGKIVMPYNVWTHNDNVFTQNVDHGTHVAGIAIGNADNNIGISGIAPMCRFMPVQVADKNGIMTTTSVLDGIIYALYQGADVINVSLGQQFAGLDNYPESLQRELINNHFKEEERLWREVMRIAQKHNNATIVVAAGNDNVLAGIEALQRPELFVTVSATDKNSSPIRKTEFSNYGEYSTISAPGVDIYSSYKNGYESMPGTSMAAPIVSGTIALMKSIKKDINNQQIICTLQTTGKPIRDDVGNLIQICHALKKIQTRDIDDCIPEPSSGDVQVLLSWNNYNDLDLLCVDPNNDIVCFKQKKVPSGGQLEIDMNVNEHHSKQPIENIYWPTNGAPHGTYHVLLLYYAQHETNINKTPYKVTVRYGGKEEIYEGYIEYSEPKEATPICSFTLGNEQQSSQPAQQDENSNKEAERQRTKQQLEKRRADLQRQLEEVNNQLNNL